MDAQPVPARQPMYVTTASSSADVEHVLLHGSPAIPTDERFGFSAVACISVMVAIVSGVMAITIPVAWVVFGCLVGLAALAISFAISNNVDIRRAERLQLAQLIEDKKIVQIDPFLIEQFTLYLRVCGLRVKELQPYVQLHSTEFLAIQQDILPIITRREQRPRWTTWLAACVQLVLSFEKISADLWIDKNMSRARDKETRRLEDFRARAILRMYRSSGTL